MIFCVEDYWVGVCTGFGWGAVATGILFAMLYRGRV